VEEKTIWIIYNGVAIVLSLMMINGTNDKLYQTVGLFLTLTFITILFGYFGLMSTWIHPTILLTSAYLLFIIKVIKSYEVKSTHKILLTILPSSIILTLYISAFHLTNYYEAKFISALILVIVIAYYTIVAKIKKDSEEKREALEINGLFAIILLSNLIR